MKLVCMLLTCCVMLFASLTVQGMSPEQLYLKKQIETDPNLAVKLKPILENSITYGTNLVAALQTITDQVSKYTTQGTAILNKIQAALNTNNLPQAQTYVNNFLGLDNTLQVEDIVLAVIQSNPNLEQKVENVNTILNKTTIQKNELLQALQTAREMIVVLNNIKTHLLGKIAEANTILENAKISLNNNEFAKTYQLAYNFNQLKKDENVAAAIEMVLLNNSPLADNLQRVEEQFDNLLSFVVFAAIKKQITDNQATRNKLQNLLKQYGQSLKDYIKNNLEGRVEANSLFDIRAAANKISNFANTSHSSISSLIDKLIQATEEVLSLTKSTYYYPTINNKDVVIQFAPRDIISPEFYDLTDQIISMSSTPPSTPLQLKLQALQKSLSTLKSKLATLSASLGQLRVKLGSR